MADNLTQIGTWTLKGFTKEHENINLYLKLSRKDVEALKGFPMAPEFTLDFEKCCRRFNKLVKEYQNGISDHRIWAKWMITLGTNLTQTATLV